MIEPFTLSIELHGASIIIKVTIRAIASVSVKFFFKKKIVNFTYFYSKTTHINGPIILCIYKIAIVAM